MTAKQMFEELGYKKINTCCYVKEIDRYMFVVDFTCELYSCYWYDTSDVDCHLKSLHIDKPLFKAINKQLDEFGLIGSDNK